MTRNWLAITLLATVITAVAEEPTLPEDTRAAYAWFDKLGLPSLEGRELVRVSVLFPGQKCGGNEYYAPTEVHLPPTYAILLGRHSNSVAVLTFDLVDVTLPEHPEFTGENGEPLELRCEVLDLESVAKKWLQELQTPNRKPDWQFGQRLTDRGRTFLWSRICAANGLKELAGPLYAEAATMRSGHGSEDQPPPRESFLSRLKLDVAHALMWRTVELIADDDVSRTELLRRFQCVADDCSTNQHVESAREYVEILERMVREDEEQADRQRRRAGREPTTEERVADLIYGLREINETAWRYSGESEPVRELRAVGHAAVPQLLDALDDTTLTRTVWCWRTHSFSHRVTRVEPYVQKVLGEITGRTSPADGGFVAIGNPAEQWYRDWWRDMQEKGELEVLSIHTASGRRYSPEQARRLVARNPGEALDVIRKGIDSALARDRKGRGEELASEGCREVVSGLVSATVDIPGVESEQFLRRYMTAGTSLETRLAAAKALDKRGSPDGIVQMIKEWKSFRDEGPESEPKGDFIAIGSWWTGQYPDPCELIAFLAARGGEEGAVALARGFESRTRRERQFIVSAFLPHWGGDPFAWPSALHTLTNGVTEAARERNRSEALRDLLTTALYDTERCDQTSEWLCRLGTVPGFERTCDLAAYVLAQCWPETYRFDPDGPREQHDEQRVACLNATRRLRGLPGLVLLGGRFFEEADAEEVASLLNRITAGGEDLDAARRQIVKLGLPALRHVVQHTDALAEEHPARDALDVLVVQLSSIVREVRCEQASTPEALKPLLDEMAGAFEGKPLTGGALAAFFAGALRVLPADESGLVLTAGHDGELTGVVLGLASGSVPLGSGRPTHWFRADYVSAGEEVLLSERGRVDAVQAFSEDYGRTLAERINAGFSTNPNVPVSVRLEWVRASGDEE